MLSNYHMHPAFSKNGALYFLVVDVILLLLSSNFHLFAAGNVSKHIMRWILKRTFGLTKFQCTLHLELLANKFIFFLNSQKITFYEFPLLCYSTSTCRCLSSYSSKTSYECIKDLYSINDAITQTYYQQRLIFSHPRAQYLSLFANECIF